MPNPSSPQGQTVTAEDIAFGRGHDAGMRERAEELVANKRLLDAAYQEIAALRGSGQTSEGTDAEMTDLTTLEARVREAREAFAAPEVQDHLNALIAAAEALGAAKERQACRVALSKAKMPLFSRIDALAAIDALP